MRQGDRWVATLEQLDRHGLQVDLLQIWLTKGWRKDWVERERLEQLISQMREQSRILGDAIRDGESPTQAPQLTPEQVERLKALGYIE